MSSKEILIRAGFNYKPILEAYAYAILKDWNLSEDAVQEVFVQLSLNWKKLDENNLLAWMKTLTRNKSVDIIRKRKRVVYNDNVFDLVSNYFDKYLDDAENELSHDRRFHLQTCLQKIDKTARRVILGFYRDSKTSEELGSELRRSANSVRILMHRTRDSLRSCIKLGIEAEK